MNNNNIGRTKKKILDQLETLLSLSDGEIEPIVENISALINKTPTLMDDSDIKTKIHSLRHPLIEGILSGRISKAAANAILEAFPTLMDDSEIKTKIHSLRQPLIEGIRSGRISQAVANAMLEVFPILKDMKENSTYYTRQNTVAGIYKKKFPQSTVSGGYKSRRKTRKHKNRKSKTRKH